jgi:hypothetical protein
MQRFKSVQPKKAEKPQPMCAELEAAKAEIAALKRLKDMKKKHEQEREI